LYASGIGIKDVVVYNFTSSVVPPLPGMSASHSLSAAMDMMYSTDGGVTYSPAVMPVNMTYQITCRLGGDGVTEYYDTEMTQFDANGSGPGSFILLRESPTKPSLGRISERGTGGNYNIESFFDIFTEVSVDGGMTWLPSIKGLSAVVLDPRPCNHCSDFDESGITDMADMAELSRNWLWEESVGDRYNIADLDCNGRVKTPDLLLFAANWLGSCP
jgi:hypothetical protein